MRIYNSTNYNQTGAFSRLVYAVRSAKEEGRRFSIFIGAGCSLSSSPVNITTQGIIENSILDSFDPKYKSPNSWEELYRTFVNEVWEPRGEIERRKLLSKQFLNLEPAKGYIFLRKLIENEFITDIITTNFDILVNKALEGLPYQLHIGEQSPKTINGGTKIKVYKVHGDIESGELRFSPNDLKRLPESISNFIRNTSSNATLFCGYSGQDEGLMECLEKSNEYSVYWASPQKPLENDIYSNSAIYDWMRSRNSQNNFIYGDDLGKFDSLMEQLYFALSKNVTSGTSLWEKSTINKAIQINDQVYFIFEQLLRCSSSLRSKYEWKKAFPFYAKNYETILNAYLYYYQESNNLPLGLLQIPENEIEALIMGISIEILASASGISVSPQNFINLLKIEYESMASKYKPDISFWQALTIVITSVANNAPIQQEEKFVDVKLIMNSKGRMTLSVKEPRLRYVIDTVALLGVSGLFIPTCEKDTDIDRIGKSKIILQQYGQGIRISDDKLCFKLNGVSKSELKDVFEAFFEPLGGYNLDNSTNTIIGTKVIVTSEITEKSKITGSLSLSDYLYDLSKNTIAKFLRLKSAFEIDSSHYIRSSLSDELDGFIRSNKLGMFVVGSSGSGKTKAIQNFIVSSSSFSNHLIAVASPKTSSFGSSLGLSVFFNDLLQGIDEKNLFKKIDELLQLRNSKLILIIDGLNEIEGGTETCLSHYRSIIENIENLNTLNISSIKILVTCRDHAFLDYCEQASLYPSSKTCYYTVDANNITPYFFIKPLDLDQQLKFAEIYCEDLHQREIFKNNIKTNPHIQQMFNQPYLMAVAGKYYNSIRLGQEISTLQDIFKFFSEQMLKRLGDSSTMSIAYSIINTYYNLMIIENFGRRITPFTLLSRISSEVNLDLAHSILKDLCDINLFTSLHSEEYIRFTHDRIEEYFLSEYLYNRSKQSESLTCVANLAKNDHLIHSALIIYFGKLTEQRLFEQLIEECDILYNDTKQLPCVLVACLAPLNTEEYVDLFTTALERSKLEANSFVMLVLEGLKQAIAREDIVFPESLITSYSLLSAQFGAFSQYNEYFYYIVSRFYLLRKGDVNRAEEYCDLALEQKEKNEHLTQLAFFQKAVIQKNKGQLDEAIDKLTLIFSYFSQQMCWEEATECVLEWGSALRGKTQFNDALKVYKQIKIDDIAQYPILKMKLHRKIGTIYKNLMQQKLWLYCEGTNSAKLERDIQKFYTNAQNEFEISKKMSLRIIDNIEKMKIIAEQIETALKFSYIESNQIMRAEFLLADMEKMLALFPVPDIQILYMRHLASYKGRKGEINDAITILEQARAYALNYANTFRIFEINYQHGRLIERHKENLAVDIILKGINSLNDAIKTNIGDDNEYTKNCINAVNSLKDFMNKYTNNN